MALRTGRHAADLASLASGLAGTCGFLFVYSSKSDIDEFVRRCKNISVFKMILGSAFYKTGGHKYNRTVCGICPRSEEE